ncbi:unnamed protein product [Phyllotreta striolata]|uniref:Uncharacterized protein n=1 Tax=Phyllotreta striolata TaxID=444603 RepID=A0A9N9TI43_PHYSR|nr:unnamed protein product [Phyllotreta striolata]
MSDTDFLVNVETNNVSWRKRKREEETLQLELKKPRSYYYRLASESSKGSEEDTESVYSLQGRETDLAKDTTDTDEKSDSDDEYEVIEYEVASLSESDHGILGTTETDSDISDSEVYIAAIDAVFDSSVETWITDCEESDNSSLDDSVETRLGFSTCVQCKFQNDNPLYRYCEKCFQTCKQCKKFKTYKCFPLCIDCHKDRKKLYPPRPRATKKSKRKQRAEPPVKLDTLRSCLSGLSSQDSGLGSSSSSSSQECPPLGLDQIVVPGRHLKPGTNKSDKIEEKDIERESGRKRRASDSSLSDFDIKKPKYSRAIAPKEARETDGKASVSLSQASTETCLSSSQTSTKSCEIARSNRDIDHSDVSAVSPTSELCIICNSAPKDSIFLHTRFGHQCCCYKCAKRTLHMMKRCPICNMPVNKVIKIFQA